MHDSPSAVAPFLIQRHARYLERSWDALLLASGVKSDRPDGADRVLDSLFPLQPQRLNEIQGAAVGNWEKVQKVRAACCEHA